MGGTEIMVLHAQSCKNVYDAEDDGAHEHRMQGFLPRCNSSFLEMWWQSPDEGGRMTYIGDYLEGHLVSDVKSCSVDLTDLL